MQDYTSWAAGVRQELQVEESALEPSSGLLKLSAHQQLRAELEAQEELQQRATQLGQQALMAVGTPIMEVGPFLWCPQPSLPHAWHHCATASLSSEAPLRMCLSCPCGSPQGGPLLPAPRSRKGCEP